MGAFKDSLSELGFFWPAEKPENKWPGRVFMDDFPRARLHCLNDVPGDGKVPDGRGTFHGITEGNECITMFEANALDAGLSLREIGTTRRVSVSANYMLVGNRHYDDRPTVRRVTFSSACVEHTQGLAAIDYRDLRQRAIKGTHFKRTILHRQVASYVDFQHRIRIRVWRSTAPNYLIKPTSKISIDFLDLVTPLKALNTLNQFSDLLAVTCGDLIDLWDIEFIHRTEEGHQQTEVHFFDPVERPQKRNEFRRSPIVKFTGNRALFRTIMKNWLAETHDRRIARAAFEGLMRDKGVVRLSHHRELVTIIELLETTKETAPLNKARFRAVRAKMRDVLDDFAAHDPESSLGIATLRGRIENINYHDAIVVVKKFLDTLPSGFISFPEGFSGDAVKLRNILTHRLGEFTNSDFGRLAFYIAKLKAAVVLWDIIALGATARDVQKDATIILLADRTPADVFGPADDDSPAEH